MNDRWMVLRNNQIYTDSYSPNFDKRKLPKSSGLGRHEIWRAHRRCAAEHRGAVPLLEGVAAVSAKTGSGEADDFQIANTLAMASNVLAMASNLTEMASNLRAMASNLRAMASNLRAMASNLRAMASNLRAMAPT